MRGNRRYKKIQKISHGKNVFKRLIVVVLWVILSTGIYWCSTSTKDDNNAGEKSEEIKKDELYEIEEPDKEENILLDDIRVLIKTDEFKSIYHEKIIISCENGFFVEEGNYCEEYGSFDEFVADETFFRRKNVKNIKIWGKAEGKLHISSLKRKENVFYRGILECYNTEDGIVVINELKVDEYLYGVVPSEMPSSYPKEALKAQAISARTYTYFHKKNYAYPEWQAHVDDSTSFQVYKNIEETTEAIEAVNETENEVLTYKGEIIESFYYSTSGGFNGGAKVWGSHDEMSDYYLCETGDELFAQNNEEGECAYRSFIDEGNPKDVEYGEVWYRWVYDKSLDDDNKRKFLTRLYELSRNQPQKVKIRSRYLAEEKLLDETIIRDIRILERQKSGLVTGLLIETENFTVSVSTQHVIRQALSASGDTIIKNDGSQYNMGDILASAYFYIEKIRDNNENGDNLKGIVIHGAGLGHGCGMSQNGAKVLAEKGFTAYEILAYYYNGAIKSIRSLD